ncbi:MAG: MaoC family dehydratase, partial [Acidobacteria bacterium]|nr:MaoC family dehydratase [Acidobacteriota bacterium]
RESASRPHAGIVTVRTRGLNQDGDECLSYVRSALIYKRGFSHDAGMFPEAARPLTIDEG